MKKCSYCGAEAADDIRYCEQCGRPFDAQEPTSVRPVTVDMARERENALNDAKSAAEACEQPDCTCAKAEPACAPAREAAPLQASAPAAASSAAAAPEAAPVSAAPEGKASGKPMAAAVSTGSYFWLTVLYSIPVLGLVCSIIAAVSAQNLSRRNFARSVLIIKLICLFVSLALAVAVLLAKDQAVAWLRALLDSLAA